jgi:acyl dehydratase
MDADTPETHGGLRVGQLFTTRREIIVADIAAFAELVGDHGDHHHAESGPPMAHGLLTVSVATRIGGDLNFVARRMDWVFLKPVWAGDTITARVTIKELTERRSGTGVQFDVEIVNQHDEAVATGDVYGVIPG